MTKKLMPPIAIVIWIFTSRFLYKAIFGITYPYWTAGKAEIMQFFGCALLVGFAATTVSVIVDYAINVIASHPRRKPTSL